MLARAKRGLRRVVGYVCGLSLLAWLALTGCGVFGPSNPRAARFECAVRAVEPLVGEVYDARELVRDLYAGKASLGAVIGNLEASAPEIMQLMRDLKACEPPPPPDAAPEPQGVML
jgi:hypothetical protein